MISYISGEPFINGAPLKRVAVNFAGNGNNTLVAAVTGKKIRVISGLFMAAGTLTVTFQSGAGGTGLTGAISLVANVGFVLSESELGHFETAAATLLNAATSAGIQVSGYLNYIEV